MIIKLDLASLPLLIFSLITGRMYGFTRGTLRVARTAASSRRRLSPLLQMEEQQQAFDTGYHAPVMWKECISALLASDRYQACNDNPGGTGVSPSSSSSSGVFVDGTRGGGGHSSALLKNLQPGDVVIGCDVDSDALATASKRLSDFLGSKSDELPLFLPV